MRFALGLPLLATLPAAAPAQEEPPPVTASARETVDVWTVARGGVRGGTVVQSKLQVSATVQGAIVGDPGGAVHIQLFRTDGRSLSARAGDIQTISNIEAPAVTRLFEAWAEQRVGRTLALRAGLMDLNADFDPLEVPALFVNSSHGIGPDISQSGRNGPSIYPVTAPGTRIEWRPDGRVTLRAAAFDGVPGDPDRPGRFAAVRVRRRDGALLIGQADYRLPGGAKLEVGGWHYTARGAGDAIAGARRRDGGAYASAEGALSDRWSAWLRVGIADGRAQPVSGYVGGGAIVTGLLRGRGQDQAGLGVAHAIVSPLARRLDGLPGAETTVEATYQAQLGRFVAVQPDVQWVHHPAGVAGARDALVFGLRLVLIAGYPAEDASGGAADPTVPPDAVRATAPAR